MTNEEYIFPKDNWYIEITDDNRELVNNCKIKQKWNRDLFEYLQYTYVSFDGSGWGKSIPKGISITTSQFKEYVLNEKEEIIISEDLSYLEELLNKLNIK